MSRNSINISTSLETISSESILFFGDFCPINRAANSLRNNEHSNLLGEFSCFIKKAAISLANLEAPVKDENSTPIRKAGPSIAIPPRIIPDICSLGFSALGLANNHILDYGEDAMLTTQQALKQNGMQSFGAGANSDVASRPFTFILAKKSYAVIGACDREFSAAGNDTPGAFSPTDGKLALHIVNLRKKYDHVILYYHGGNEYYRYPSPGFRAKCHLFADAGASGVICNHSHVPGAVEFYNDVPIVYSLGNFVFDRGLKRPKDWYFGYAVALTPSDNDSFNLTIIPYRQFDETPAVTLLSGIELEDFSNFLSHQQMVLNDKMLLESKWTEWCETNRQEYIGRLLGMNRFSKKLYKILKYPLFRLKLIKRLYIYNLINCSAHREVLLSLLSRGVKRE